MKKATLFIISVLFTALQGCVKESTISPSNLPNGDFEGWTASDELQSWKTNSCPECYTAFNSYVVQKTTEAYHGQYAAKLIFNGVYSAVASDLFAVPSHPMSLSGYSKCTLNTNDTVSIKVQVFSHNTVVDSGLWLNTISIPQYKQFVVPITQSSVHADSVLITIRGGNKIDTGSSGSVLWIDYLSIH
jgi:hypothetical protein